MRHQPTRLVALSLVAFAFLGHGIGNSHALSPTADACAGGVDAGGSYETAASVQLPLACRGQVGLDVGADPVIDLQDWYITPETTTLRLRVCAADETTVVRVKTYTHGTAIRPSDLLFPSGHLSFAIPGRCTWAGFALLHARAIAVEIDAVAGTGAYTLELSSCPTSDAFQCMKDWINENVQ